MDDADSTSRLLIALAGGAMGATLAALFALSGRALAAWREIALHDEEATERNAQLLVWVDDRTRALVRELQAISEDHNKRGIFHSSIHGGALADAKALALHQYRDEEWSARLDLARLRAQEGPWHVLWRRLRRRSAPALTVRDQVEPFLERWREPVTRHGSGPTDAARVLDRTTREHADAVAELRDLNLT